MDQEVAVQSKVAAVTGCNNRKGDKQMKNTMISKWMKTLTAGVLSAALVLAGTVTIPSEVKAADPAVHWTAATNEAFQAWKDSKAVPTEEGFLFGGWYKDAAGKQALETTEASTYTGDVYAKFVPSYVLSVKTQLDGTTQNNSAADGLAASLRVITGVDSLDYQYIGADIYLGNVKKVAVQDQTTVYKNLLASDDAGAWKVSAQELFGTAAEYLSVWNIVNIADVNDENIIYVRPYWVTMDGTKVYGMSKYVHVVDGYKTNGYVSIPINVMTASTAAAGIATINYDSTKMTFVGMEKGRVFDDAMEYSEANGTVKIVGNGATVDQYKADETLFANVRFKLNDGIELYSVNTNTNVMTRANGYFDFTISNPDFSDWNENTVDAGAWNIQY